MHPDQRLTLAAGVLVLSAGLASCSDSNLAPTAPGTRALQSLSISRLREDFSVGETLQLRADAAWSNGDREDVTTSVRWSSKTLACVVTASGLATALEEGNCSVDAAYGGVSANVLVRVNPSRVYTISGVVREKWGFREPPIPGATVTLTSGTQAGRTVTTDGAGRYVLTAVPMGPVSARAEASGYEASTTDLSPDRATADFFLVPPFDVISWTSTSGTGPPPVSPSLTLFDVRHRGPVTLTILSTGVECANEYPTFFAQVEDLSSGNYPLSEAACPGGTERIEESILDPGRYELAIYWRNSVASGTLRRVDLKHPR